VSLSLLCRLLPEAQQSCLPDSLDRRLTFADQLHTSARAHKSIDGQGIAALFLVLQECKVVHAYKCSLHGLQGCSTRSTSWAARTRWCGTPTASTPSFRAR